MWTRRRWDVLKVVSGRRINLRHHRRRINGRPTLRVITNCQRSTATWPALVIHSLLNIGANIKRCRRHWSCVCFCFFGVFFWRGVSLLFIKGRFRLRTKSKCSLWEKCGCRHRKRLIGPFPVIVVVGVDGRGRC